MMFIQYTGMGVFMPMMGHYLNGYLAFDPYRVGLVLSMPAVAAFVSPLLVATIADRWMSAERLLASLHFLACGAIMFVWTQTGFWQFLIAYLLFWLVFAPTLAMTNTVAFHHLADARRDFGPVRVWGTIGWVIVGFLFGLLWLRHGGIDRETSRLPHAFIFAAATSAVMGMYALTLPVTEKAMHRSERASPWKGMSVFRKRSMMILCGITLVNTILNMFYINWMSPYLNQLGFAEGWILPLLSVGQISEILVIGGLGYLIGRVGLKGALLIGLCTQALRFVIFTIGPSAPLLVMAIGLHGLTYGCFFIVAMIYVDNHCTRHNRASAQLLLNTVIGGFGNLTGSLAAGAVAQTLTVADTRLIDYQRFWFVPAAVCVALTIVFLAIFREEPATPIEPEYK
jgi:nucleoside transporter